MANNEHLRVLKQGIKAWNAYRKQNPSIRPDLRDTVLCDGTLRNHGSLSADASLHRAFVHQAYSSDLDLNGINLSGADLCGADMRDVYLTGADLSHANLTRANLSNALFIETELLGANLIGADLSYAHLRDADLSELRLTGANLTGANLACADLTRADLSNTKLISANLTHALLIETNLTGAVLTGARVVGSSIQNVRLDNILQFNLVLTPHGQPEISVDTLEVAQQIGPLLDNSKIPDATRMSAKKWVLILGHFADKPRCVILNALRDTLRAEDYLPITFNSEQLTGRDWTETIKILAGISQFVIADITDLRLDTSVLEVMPDYRVPFVPIIQQGKPPLPTVVDLQHKYPWMTDIRWYKDQIHLLNAFNTEILNPALEMRQRLRVDK